MSAAEHDETVAVGNMALHGSQIARRETFSFGVVEDYDSITIRRRRRFRSAEGHLQALALDKLLEVSTGARMTVNQQNLSLRFDTDPCDGVIVRSVAVGLWIARAKARLERRQAAFRRCDLIIERL